MPRSSTLTIQSLADVFTAHHKAPAVWVALTLLAADRGTVCLSLNRKAIARYLNVKTQNALRWIGTCIRVLEKAGWVRTAKHTVHTAKGPRTVRRVWLLFHWQNSSPNLMHPLVDATMPKGRKATAGKSKKGNKAVADAAVELKPVKAVETPVSPEEARQSLVNELWKRVSSSYTQPTYADFWSAIQDHIVRLDWNPDTATVHIVLNSPLAQLHTRVAERRGVLINPQVFYAAANTLQWDYEPCDINDVVMTGGPLTDGPPRVDTDESETSGQPAVSVDGLLKTCALKSLTHHGNALAEEEVAPLLFSVPPPSLGSHGDGLVDPLVD